MAPAMAERPVARTRARDKPRVGLTARAEPGGVGVGRGSGRPGGRTGAAWPRPLTEHRAKGSGAWRHLLGTDAFTAAARPSFLWWLEV